MKIISCLIALSSGLLLSACQSTPESSYANNPTDSGSRFSYYSLPSSRMAEQNVDLDD
jgi:starvation-inducible outer membrane lipoprotein